MSSYQKPEFDTWPVIQNDPSLKAAIEGMVFAGEILHQAYYKSFESGRFVKQPNPESYIVQSERSMAEAIRRLNPLDLIIGKTISRGADHSKGNVWLLNGIDGFDNFTNGRPFCDVMVVQTENGIPIRSAIYDFIHGELFYAAKGEGSYVNGQQIFIPDAEMTNSTVIAYAPLVVKPERGIPEDQKLVNALWRGMERITKKYGQFQREFQAGGVELCYVADGRLGGYASSWTTRNNLGGVLNVQEAGGVATNMDGSEWRPGMRGVVAASPKIHRVILENFQRYLK